MLSDTKAIHLKEEALTELTSFGEWLKRQRSGRGLTQEQLARQIGCATITLRKIEAEERRPSADIADQLIKIFEIPQDERNNFLRFSRGDWTKAPRERSDAKPWQEVNATLRVNLPATVTALLGREKPLAEIHDYLLRAEIRLVTLIGPPGMGKTRLSIEAARKSISDFRDGVFFAGLAPINDPNLIVATVRQSLGYVEVPKLPPDQHLRQAIGDKQMLIVLDNCEHLVAEAATFASGLLSACSNLKILATSREALHIPGEWLYAVPPLDLPQETPQNEASFLKYPALALFEERARAVRNDFSLAADNVQTVSEICGRLDGLPLAIELIAARIRLMSPHSLLERLSGQFILTADGTRSTPERQKTLNNAILWSYNLLPAEEQKLFAYLSVFSGSFMLETAEAMFSSRVAEQPVSDLISLLLDKSLLQLFPNENNEPRYTMLVTIHEFARKRLLERGDEVEIRNLHLSYFCELAEQARSQLQGTQQLAWLDRLDQEYGNIRAALNWAQESGAIADGLRLAADLEWFWIWRAHLQEPILALEDLLAHPLPADEMQALARGHYIAGLLEHMLGSLTQVLGNLTVRDSHVRECEQLCLLLGAENKENLADAKFLRVYCMDFTVAHEIRQRYEEAVELFQEVGNQWKIAFAIFCMGFNLWRNGDFAGARQEFERSLQLFRNCGDNFGASKPDRLLAHMAMEEGKYAEARAKFEEILLLYQQARLNFLIDQPLWTLSMIAVREGDYARAKELYTECLLFDQQIGLPRQFAECFIGFAGIASAEKRWERAAQLLGAGEAEVETRGIPLENIDRIEVKRLTALLREELGDAKYEALASQGRAMTMEQVIAYALEEQAG